MSNEKSPESVLSEEDAYAAKMVLPPAFQQPPARPLSSFKWEGNTWYEKHPWSKGINTIIDQMQAFNDQNPDHPFVILQIKEKFGTLRFYYTFPKGDLSAEAQEKAEEIADCVKHITDNSQFLCQGEDCGSIEGEPYFRMGGWLTILCKNCQAKDLNAA